MKIRRSLVQPSLLQSVGAGLCRSYVKKRIRRAAHTYGADEFATDYERNTAPGSRHIGCQSRNKRVSAFHLIEKNLGRALEGRGSARLPDGNVGRAIRRTVHFFEVH